MPPYNFPIELLTHTSTLKLAQQASAQKAAQTPPKPKPGPMDHFAHWPPEMAFLINRYPDFRFALLEALDKEVKLGNLKR